MVKLTAFGITLLWAALLLVAGCAGITPYDPPDYREEPPGMGLFTGEEGEFIIYRKAVEPEAGSEEKKGEIKGGDQQP